MDKLLNYLKLKANRAFFIATINIVKQCCLEIVEILLNDTYNQLLSNLGANLSSDNYEGIIFELIIILYPKIIKKNYIYHIFI